MSTAQLPSERASRETRLLFNRQSHMYHDTSSAGGFVQRSGSQLQLDGKPFYFVGANAYWLIASSTDRSKVDTMMAKAKVGLTDDSFLYVWTQLSTPSR